jgi:hypothetical protein
MNKPNPEFVDIQTHVVAVELPNSIDSKNVEID